MMYRCTDRYTNRWRREGWMGSGGIGESLWSIVVHCAQGFSVQIVGLHLPHPLSPSPPEDQWRVVRFHWLVRYLAILVFEYIDGDKPQTLNSLLLAALESWWISHCPSPPYTFIPISTSCSLAPSTVVFGSKLILSLLFCILPIWFWFNPLQGYFEATLDFLSCIPCFVITS